MSRAGAAEEALAIKTQQIVSLKEELADSREQYDNEIKSNKEQAKEIERLKSENATLKQNSSDAQSANSELLQERDETIANQALDLEALRETLASTKQILKEQAALADRAQELETELKEKSDKAEMTEQQLKKEIETLKEQLKESEDARKKESEASEQRFKESEEAHKNETDLLNKSISEGESRIKELEAEVELQKNRVDELQAECDNSYKPQIAELTEARQKLQEENEILLKQKEEAEEKLVPLEQQIADQKTAFEIQGKKNKQLIRELKGELQRYRIMASRGGVNRAKTPSEGDPRDKQNSAQSQPQLQDDEIYMASDLEQLGVHMGHLVEENYLLEDKVNLVIILYELLYHL